MRISWPIAILVATAVPAAAQDPQTLLDNLIRHEQHIYDQSRQNEAVRLEIERRDLAEQLHLRDATDSEVMAELTRYCPTGAPPCQAQPPAALIQEAARRGLITVASPAPGTQCVIVPPVLDCQ